jgi:hypothetical protein
MEVARGLPAPLLLACALAARLTFRLQAEPLVIGIAWMRLEPNPTVTTLSEPFRAHRLPPLQTGKNTTNNPTPTCPSADRSVVHAPQSALTAIHHVTAKKKEDDPFGSSRSEEKGSFRSTEEDTFRFGVHTMGGVHR